MKINYVNNLADVRDGWLNFADDMEHVVAPAVQHATKLELRRMLAFETPITFEDTSVVYNPASWSRIAGTAVWPAGWMDGGDIELLNARLKQSGVPSIRYYASPAGIAMAMLGHYNHDYWREISDRTKIPHRNITEAAFHGGRVDCFERGTAATAVEIDLRCAYANVLKNLRIPRSLERCYPATDERTPETLSFATWRARSEYDLSPLPTSAGGDLLWEGEGTGWYYEIELQAAEQAGAVVERTPMALSPAGYYESDFAWIEEWIEERSNPAYGNLVKLGLSAVWGLLARPESGNRWLAGLVTATVRAQMLEWLTKSKRPFQVLTDCVVAEDLDVPDSSTITRENLSDLRSYGTGVYTALEGVSHMGLTLDQLWQLCNYKPGNADVVLLAGKRRATLDDILAPNEAIPPSWFNCPVDCNVDYAVGGPA